MRHIRERTAADEHVLIIPGERDECIETERARTYTIKSPLISRTSRYRMLLRLGEVERILMLERPDLVESGDPYQVAWKAVHSGAALCIPVIGFYHSHFPEAYVRTAQKFCGSTVTEFFLDCSRRYVRNLYNRFERTLIPSPALGALLADWGVNNIALTDLGVDTANFQPIALAGEDPRAELNISRDRTLLLYVGRLAQEKNTHTLFAAFEQITRAFPGRFHLLVVGDGLQRTELRNLQTAVAQQPPIITHLPYCADQQRLAAIYRAADLFVHPGVQETFGLVTLEAQACGTPVIGIRGSYMDRIIHSDQTLWAGENSASALAAAIEETSRADLREMGARAGEAVRSRYAWEKIFARLFALYSDTIAHYRPR